MRGLIKSELAYPNLWRGCVGAWCPSVDRSRGTLLTDWSPARNHGTLTNMDPASDWVVSGGKVGLDFDGTNDYVNTSNVPMLVTTGTLSCWIYHNTVAVSTWAIGHINAGTNRIYLQILTGPVYSLGLGDQGTANGFTPVTGVWTHLAGTYSTTTGSLYVNGRLVSTGARAGVLTSITGIFSFGALGVLSVGYANCKMDDVRFYNRQLDASEISLLARRRGIAYEASRNRSYKASATGSRRRRIICGANC